VKVLHLVHYFPPEFRGGTEACVEALVAEQLRRGDGPEVLAGTDERADDPCTSVDRSGPVAVHRILRQPAENYSVDHRLPRMAQSILDCARQLRPDVVHVHHTLNLTGDVCHQLRSAGFPVVATLHDYTLVCSRFFLARPDGESCAEAFPLPSDRCHACVLPDFPAGADALSVELEARGQTARAEASAMGLAIVPSETVRRRWLASGLFDPTRLITLPHPVALAARAPPAARDRSDGRLILATWGHLAPAKGVLDVLSAMALADDSRLGLIVLGEPTEPEHGSDLRRAAEGLDVRFEGRYEADDLTVLRGRADLAIFPSRAEETFGLVVAEARALGFGVLVSDRGALPERVGGAGDVFPAADPAALAARLTTLLDTPATLATWATRARVEGVDDGPLTPAAHADRLAGLYARVMTADRR
jgi:glycosyltransferase involved in cell wall biosynthesis